jgi:hypothetical protein
VENPARSVDKEEKTEIELLIRAYLGERISQVANTAPTLPAIAAWTSQQVEAKAEILWYAIMCREGSLQP